jgi:excinuclease ABC subunit C
MTGEPGVAAAAGFDLKSFLKSLPARPGVYRMLDTAGSILYVGKARHLKNRVSSYFHGRTHADRTLAMLAQVAGVEITVTASETEALLLEYNLIKQHKPRYNVLLKDDKSFPFIHVSGHEYPRIAFYRGTRKLPGRFFGPYPSAAATRETLLLLQKLFRLRPCEDTFFANRSRPCLQYQIHRCTGPCVRLITPEAYAQDVADAMKVLEGRNNELIEDLDRRMEQASTRLEFEQAARLRDQIQMLKQIQATQVITRMAGHDIDAVGIACEGGATCVSVVFVRGGRNLGSSNYFPKGGLGDESEMLGGFLSQYYFAREAPAEILLSRPIEASEALAQALTDKAGHEVEVRSSVRGTRARWLEMARNNARLGLRMRASTRATIAEQLAAVGHELGLERTPQRVECFDVSHSMGESPVASCVVFGPEGPLKGDYRRFNLRGVTPGDDYAGIEQAVERRFARVLKGEAPMPDLLMIDGGPGQLNAATAALARLGVAGLAVIAIAKGADRKAGQERLFFPGRDAPLILSEESPALRLIQRVRDESHRFAITGHRQSRDRRRRESWLEEIPGLGPKRRRELLRAFGGLQGVRQASVEDLAKVHGISRQLAQEIYERMNPGP